MNRDFIFHCDDYAESVLLLPPESAGRLILALIAYATEKESPESILEDDIPAKSLYFVMKGRIDRDLEYRRNKSIAGKKGGAPIGNNNATKQTETSKNKQKQAEGNQKQTPNPNPNPNPINEKIIVEVLKHLNDKAGTKYGQSKETVKLINARIRDGFTEEDFKKVIDKKVEEWKGTELAHYIRPSTLFAPSHFEEYLNAPEKVPFKPLQHSQLHHMMKADYDMADLEKKLIKN